jgi:diguanylate cyclase (GGDEF)-like protein
MEAEMTPQAPSPEVSDPSSGEPPPSAPTTLEDLVAESEPSDVVEPVVAHTEAPSSLRRPLYRVGEVPIYDEPDFLTELKRELSKCRRVDRPLTLILIRIGDLGQIVELFGKDFREQVLWHIAEHAMGSLRVVDLVGMMASKDRIAMTAFASDRYGGGRIVSRMRQSVARKPFRVSEELPPIVPALDFGIASFPADGSDVEALLHRAEEDLAQTPPATSD